MGAVNGVVPGASCLVPRAWCWCLVLRASGRVPGASCGGPQASRSAHNCRMAVTIDLSGRIAWITGGASGIGRAVCRQLARAGARVVSLDLSPGEREAGIDGCVLDVRDRDAIEHLVDNLEAENLGADILVNAAGITRDGVVWRLRDEDWDAVIDVNLTGAFRMTRACAQGMRRRGRGAIVNIASINGLRGRFGQSNYAAS